MPTATRLTLVAFISSLHFYLPVFYFYLQHRGLTLFESNALQIIPLVAGALLEVPTGVFGDRIGRRLSVALGLTCIGLSEASMLIANEFWHFAALQLLLGVGFAFISGSLQAMLIDSLPAGADREAHAQRALGRYSAASQLGFVLSGLLAGWLFPDTAEVRFFWPIVATASAWLIAALIVITTRDTPLTSPAERPDSLALLRAGLRTIRTNPVLRRWVALNIFANPLGWYWILLYQPVLAASDVPRAWFGPLLAIGGLLGTVVTDNAARISAALPGRSGLLVFMLLPAVLYAAQAFPSAPLIAAALYVLHRMIFSAAQPLIDGAINTHIESTSRATTLSIFALFNTAYGALIGIPLGWLAEWSLTATCLFIALIITLSVLIIRPHPHPTS
jgi:MFS family permease